MEATKNSKLYGPSVISQICECNIYLLAGRKRKYHSNQLEKVNMITIKYGHSYAGISILISSFFMPAGNGVCNG